MPEKISASVFLLSIILLLRNNNAILQTIAFFLENSIWRNLPKLSRKIPKITCIIGCGTYFNFLLGLVKLNIFRIIKASVWDASGNETFFSDQSPISSINLNPGSYSIFGKISLQSDKDIYSTLTAGHGMISIAFDALIESAKGGSASDSITGNSPENTLHRGSGTRVKDTLIGNAGADILFAVSKMPLRI